MISDTVEKLYSGKLYNLKYKANYGLPTPSIDDLSKSISLLRAIIFPGYFEIKATDKTDMRNRIQKARDILPTINGGASQQEEAEAGEKFVNVV